MTNDATRLILHAAFQSAAELQRILPTVKEHCSAAEYDDLRLKVATAIAAIGDEITNPLLAANPGLSKQIDDEIKRYGKLL
ncbi:MAG TPA: hypothetical protein VN541_09075 [Tepidisphaeraceae bacterium]|nr:hypothetical protein [Tepidisphaeraceae bacterium]